MDMEDVDKTTFMGQSIALMSFLMLMVSCRPHILVSNVVNKR